MVMHACPPLSGLLWRFFGLKVGLTHFIDHLVASIINRRQHPEKAVSFCSSFCRKIPYRLMEEIPGHNRKNPNIAMMKP